MLSHSQDMQYGAAFWIRFVLAALATWRLSHLLVSEDGPWQIVARVRIALGASSIGRLMDCFGCVSMWVAAPASLFVFSSRMELLLCWLALSGAAFLLERMQPEPVLIERVVNQETENQSHGLLR